MIDKNDENEWKSNEVEGRKRNEKVKKERDGLKSSKIAKKEV